MIVKRMLIAFLALVLMSGCWCKKKTEKVETEKKSQEMKTAIVDRTFFAYPDSIDYTISKMSIEGDVLSVDVAYKGGSGTHQFDLMFNGMYQKSLPLKAKLYIKHSVENEKENKEITETLKFDLKPVQSPKKEPIIISLHKFDEKIKYEY